MSDATLVFIYNANSGLFNTLTDIAHKMFSPETYKCQLCDITHSYFSMKSEWKHFLNDLDYPLEFLHRDELAEKYHLTEIPLPTVMYKKGDKLTIMLSNTEIAECKDIPALEEKIVRKLKTEFKPIEE